MREWQTGRARLEQAPLHPRAASVHAAHAVAAREGRGGRPQPCQSQEGLPPAKFRHD